MKTILLFGAGKSATALIEFLIGEAGKNDWILMIADSNYETIINKTKNSPFSKAIEIDIHNDKQRTELITQASIVISMMPAAFHILIAKDCLAFGKSLLTASYVDEKIKSLEREVKDKKILFLCEMGLDPGIDHMSAMKMIDEIKKQGGVINSFKSHCGGLVSPESDDNPWHYKISWNSRNVALAGKAGADFRLDNEIVHLDYTRIFENCPEINFKEIGRLCYYPNRDSLSYIPLYQLEDCATFIRTTLRHPLYCRGWKAIVKAGLSDDTTSLPKGLTFKQWSQPIQPLLDRLDRTQFEYLGLFDNRLVPESAKTSADVLQHLLETKLAMKSGDKDMIVMLHEISYSIGPSANKTASTIESSLIVKGENDVRTAMAKTVGLPLGIATKLILNGSIQLTGIHIPVLKEIYIPVLKELENHGIRFSESIP